MAKKDTLQHTPRPNARGTTASGKSSTVYINRELSADEKSDLVAALESSDFTIEHVAQLVVDGYSFRVGSDPKSDGFIAVLTDYVDSSPTFNHALAGRGSTPINAIYACLYKHFVCFSGGWEAPQERGTPDFG